MVDLTSRMRVWSKQGRVTRGETRPGPSRTKTTTVLKCDVLQQYPNMDYRHEYNDVYTYIDLPTVQSFVYGSYACYIVGRSWPDRES